MNNEGLSKPNFCKLEDIRPGVHCYNVYCVVVACEIMETTTPRGDKLVIATGKVGDETGTLDFKLKNEHTKLLKVGSTIALRNGKSNVIEECILLELDKFGKVSEETLKINNAEKPNLSLQKWKKVKKEYS